MNDETYIDECLRRVDEDDAMYGKGPIQDRTEFEFSLLIRALPNLGSSHTPSFLVDSEMGVDFYVISAPFTAPATPLACDSEYDVSFYGPSAPF